MKLNVNPPFCSSILFRCSKNFFARPVTFKKTGASYVQNQLRTTILKNKSTSGWHKQADYENNNYNDKPGAGRFDF